MTEEISDKRFWLVDPMQLGVHYDIKHSGNFLYRLGNSKNSQAKSLKRIRIGQEMEPKLIGESSTVGGDSDPNSTAITLRPDLLPEANILKGREVVPTTAVVASMKSHP